MVKKRILEKQFESEDDRPAPAQGGDADRTVEKLHEEARNCTARFVEHFPQRRKVPDCVGDLSSLDESRKKFNFQDVEDGVKGRHALLRILEHGETFLEIAKIVPEGASFAHGEKAMDQLGSSRGMIGCEILKLGEHRLPAVYIV
jgi:hypothetical protein